ncbi:hypothetical protein AB0N07_25095 [Streptomyces sp. NPDC051172]|uniref:hypothetical protein n=1 Tax=Streptomyces sp. NPDC051172 TaxID=3155796 RepID=UPI003415DF46
MKRRAWITLGAVVLGGGGVATYAVAGPPSGHGQAKRPVKVYALALKSAASGRQELPRTQTKQFSMLGVSWKDAGKRLHGTAQVRTHSIETGEWTAWKNLEADVDPLEDPEAGAGARGASEPLWVGPSDGVQVQVVHKDGSTSSALPKGLEVSLVDPGVATAAEQKAEPAAYVADVTPTDSASATDSVSRAEALPAHRHGQHRRRPGHPRLAGDRQRRPEVGEPADPDDGHLRPDHHQFQPHRRVRHRGHLVDDGVRLRGQHPYLVRVLHAGDPSGDLGHRVRQLDGAFLHQLPGR